MPLDNGWQGISIQSQPAVGSHGFTHLKLTAEDTLIVMDTPLTKR